jgi:DNA-binding MarR family transcriptional regulator
MAKQSNALHLDQQLCFALYRASRAIIRAYAPVLEPLDLTYPQYLALLVLWQQDDVLVKDIGALLSLDSATLTPLLKRLEEKELITRRRGKDDERKVYIKLTAAGKKLREKAGDVPLAIACAAGVNVADSKQVQDIFDLRDSLFDLAAKLERN